MKVKDIKNACDKYPFIILRESDVDSFAINTKLQELKSAKEQYEKNKNIESRFISFTPCNFQEYISYKIPYGKL
jgi:hypothetical protein